MEIKVKIYSCYELTYTPIYKKVLTKLYDGQIDVNSAILEIEDISNDGKRHLNIQSQRSSKKYVTRTIRVYENDKLVHIVGLTNTNFDLDRKNEYENGLTEKEYVYGKYDYHANTYLKQGTPALFNYFYEQQKDNDDVKLSFYLLDIKETYPHNLYNVLSYRELETIGFKILNLDEVNFDKYNEVCNSAISHRTAKFPKFSKYIRDIAYISSKNSGNIPSFLLCNEKEEIDESGAYSYTVEKYLYTFKSLAAQGYDSLFKCWCLKKLADAEGTDIEFRLGKQYFAFNESEKKVADKLPKPVLETFSNAGIVLNYMTDETFMDEVKKADSTYLRHKQKNELRNQSLFRNNLRKKGIPMECILCGEDNPTILDAAHFWEVSKIRTASEKQVNDFIKINNLFDLIDMNSEYKNEIFFKKYSLVNSGENGVWMCKNHHTLFDGNYYCFDSENGKILLHFEDSKSLLDFLDQIRNGENYQLPSSVLTDNTKAFISQRQIYFVA